MLRVKKSIFFSTIMICCCSLMISGCEPLRKKFVRKKKSIAKEEFIPVLDPIDYPPARVSPHEKYAYHFSMWQVWNKDAQNVMRQDTMDKRKKYLVNQMIVQLSELKRWSPEEHVEKVDNAVNDYERILKELDKPEMMRNDSFIEGQLRRIESFMRNNLDPDIIYAEVL